MRKFNNLFIRVIVMSIFGCFLIVLADRYIPDPSILPSSGRTAIIIDQEIDQEVDQEIIPVSPNHLVSRIRSKWDGFLKQTSISLLELKNLDISSSKNEHAPSVLRYNMANLFPEEEESEENLNKKINILNLPVRFNVRKSLGGQVYEGLCQKDTEWTAELYQWINASPERASIMQSIPVSGVTGGYNPVNPLHKTEDPDTWLIPSWKEVNINFYDGDGREITLYSNAQAIASMASVNTYYTDWQDFEDFKNYTEDLWNSSHSYSVKISDVYYCTGCVDPSTPILDSANMYVKTPTDALEPTKVIETESDPDMPLPAPEAPLDALEAEPSETSKQSETTQASGQAAEIAPHTFSAPFEAGGIEEGLNSLTAAAEITNTAPAGPATDLVKIADTSETYGPAGNTTNKAEPILDGLGATAAKTPELLLNEAGMFCPGHVDLTIAAKIIGLSEKENLYSVDKASITENGRKSWTPYMKSYVNQLFSQDWKAEYGLSMAELGIGKPLSSNEISGYLSLLPSDTSPERRAVISHALDSVGKIPYYYGGKPKAAGYENNYFSTPTKPDHNGRVLSGLDCSGWINWVYWSATGIKPDALGTSGLIHEGRSVSRKDLKPGDIIVKPGTDSHVVMFLGWSDNDSIIGIHETGGSISNVTVNTMEVRWPYYRALLD